MRNLKTTLGPGLLWLPMALVVMGCPTRDQLSGGTGGGGAAGSTLAGGHSGSSGAAGAGGAAGTGGLAGAGGAAGATGNAGSAGSGAAGGSGGTAGSGASGGAAGAAGNRTDGGAPDAGCALVKGVIDFEDLAFSGSFKALPVPYIHNGFALTNYGADPLTAVGPQAIYVYVNTTAVVADNTSTTSLSRADGQLFSLLKIDLSTYNDERPGVIYTFTGTIPGHDSVMTTIPLLTNAHGFVTYTLPASFSDVSSVSWTMNTADTAQYFDNIVYSYCPGDGG